MVNGLSGQRMLLALAIGIILLIIMVLKTKIQAFLALITTTVLVGVIGGMPLLNITLDDGKTFGIINSITSGFGGTLGSIGIIIGFGVMMGQIFEVTGAAKRMAYTFLKLFGKGREEEALAFTGFLVSIPIFCDSGFVVLAPIAKALSKATKKSVIALGVSLAAGLVITHSLVPPTPGPLGVCGIFGIDVGFFILLAIVLALPMAIACIVYARVVLAKKYYWLLDENDEPHSEPYQKPDYDGAFSMDMEGVPGTLESFMPLILPIILILINTVGSALGMKTGIMGVLIFLGQPIIAVGLGLIVAIFTLGNRLDRSTALAEMEKGMMSAGIIMLVTGGGGSIGSELCRQIAIHNPKQLIIFDIYENNAYEIQQELLRKYKDKGLNLVTLIGSVRNTHRITSVMMEYKPDIVFHAAAHKHVPLMEDSPNEAIKNNVMGTYKTAKAAAEAGVKKFVLISTDKAVNPTNIMGATKRICEMIIQMMERQTPTTSYVAVRFGNVLGSNGSVIPLFKKQIAEGGPVTVTHKDITRFFMTIPEAVSLVLQASFYAKGGEIFVLDMGDPVKIDDMARNLIKLSGLRPDVDIKVEYTGLRPGEKLYEEKLMAEEGMKTTENKLIFIGKPIDMDDEEFKKKLAKLDDDSKEDDKNIRQYVMDIVPTYKPAKFD